MKISRVCELPENLKATIVFAIASFATSGINYITTPIFTRILSTSEYGLISVYNSWFEIVRVFASLTLIFPGILNVGLYEHSDNRWKYLSSMLGMTACSTLVISLFYGIFRQKVNEFFELPVNTIILMLIMCFFQPATIFWIQKQRYEIKYKSTFCVSVGTAVMSQIVSVVAVLCLKKFNYNMGVVRLWSAGIVNLCVSVFLYIYICRQGKKYVDGILWKSTLFVAIPLIPHYLSTVVLSSIDKIMISQMVGQNKTGIYSLAAILSAIGVLIWRALSVTYTPFVNSKLGEHDFTTIREAVKPLLLVVAAFCVLTALAAPEIIGILATEEYYEGIYVVPPIAAGIYTTALYDNFTAISFFHKKSFNIMIATVIAAASNIIMNYVFIMRCGYIAAGYTTLASNLILTTLHYINSRKIEKEEVYDSKFCFLSVLVVIISCLLCNFIYNFIWVRYGLIVVIILSVFKFRHKLVNSIIAMKV